MTGLVSSLARIVEYNIRDTESLSKNISSSDTKFSNACANPVDHVRKAGVKVILNVTHMLAGTSLPLEL